MRTDISHVMIRSALRCLRATPGSFRAPSCVYGRAFATRHDRPSETIKVPIGGSGDVEIDIRHASMRDDNGHRPVFIHLPPGPPLNPATELLSKLSDELIASRASTHLTINYRLSAPSSKSPRPELQYRFPQPIHDVCASFDYILTEVIPSLFPSSPAEPDDGPSIYITGSHIGGALATTLALTEPNDITAVVVYNPLADWVSLDEHVAPALLTGKSKRPIVDDYSIAAAARDLIDARTQLFSSPSSFFDPFASPALFLRAPGRDTPRTHAEALGLLDAETDDVIVPESNHRDQGFADNEQSVSGRPTPPPSPHQHEPTLYDAPPLILPDPPTRSSSETRPVRRRKVLRRWPSIGASEDVLLPYMHIITSSPYLLPPRDPRAGTQYLLAKQADELSNLLRRACFWGRESGFTKERVSFTDLGRAADGGSGSSEDGSGGLAGGAAAAGAMARWLDARVEADAAQRVRERRVVEAVASARAAGQR